MRAVSAFPSTSQHVAQNDTVLARRNPYPSTYLNRFSEGSLKFEGNECKAHRINVVSRLFPRTQIS
ncbi:hypothetical protein DEO72_LG9g198 [Vigna unguiculata]|uniref:Uncharacterized protein n=1 Tax=Vigna unguiculata TaxID=3917 RepID=A0A4D6MZG6_VIGUN|nr:hypothetical protein DEO72_LG9g198 [Vigna unguiculata]